jgi:hypothetical protein
MIPRSENWSIVLAGSWNPRIFSAEWLSKHIFGENELQVEFPDEPFAPYRFTARNVRITPSTHFVALVALDYGDATLRELERQARVILETLPHTPISAIGVNYGFVEEDPSPELLRVFTASDTAELATAGYSTDAVEVARRLIYDGGSFNLKLAWGEGRVMADFNFHREVTLCSEAAAALENSVLPNRDRSIALLSSAYASTVEMEPVE